MADRRENCHHWQWIEVGELNENRQVVVLLYGFFDFDFCVVDIGEQGVC